MQRAIPLAKIANHRTHRTRRVGLRHFDGRRVAPCLVGAVVPVRAMFDERRRKAVTCARQFKRLCKTRIDLVAPRMPRQLLDEHAEHDIARVVVLPLAARRESRQAGGSLGRQVAMESSSLSEPFSNSCITVVDTRITARSGNVCADTERGTMAAIRDVSSTPNERTETRDRGRRAANDGS